MAMDNRDLALSSGCPAGEAVKLDDGERRLIRLLSLDLGRSASPYAELASLLGWTEERVLSKIQELLSLGVIRRMGGVLVHQKSGFAANAMVVWEAGPDRLDETGEAFGKLPFVSHCYFRPQAPGWPYSLYTMVHAHGPEELSANIEAMEKISGGLGFKVLASLKELKKSSLEYFPDSLAEPVPEDG
jgi:DNA-binding Lrp family transcriptional regulator